MKVFRSFLILAALVSSPAKFAPAHAADEGRFNPPLEGVYLGLRLASVEGGLRVRAVEPGGSAERAGLREGDVLLAVETLTLDASRSDGGASIEELRGWLASRLPGEPFRVLASRAGERLIFEVRAESRLVRDANALADRMQGNRLFQSLDDKKALLRDLRERFYHASRGARSAREFYEAMHGVVGEFGISHTAVYPPWTANALVRGGAQGSFHLGLFVQRRLIADELYWFVVDLAPDGPARRSGLRVGDELVSVNGRAFGASPRRVLAGYEAHREIYTIAIDRDETVELGVRAREAGAVRSLVVQADLPLSALASSRASIDLLETAHGPVGYMRFWNLLERDLVELVRETLRGRLGSARALLIDLRGRGGTVPVLRAIEKLLLRDGRRVVLLIDRQTRSAKEVLAHLLKGQPGFTLVGETTAGAVRAATYAALPSGAMAMVPLPSFRQVVRLTGGVDLEGRGVKPDIRVDAPLAWSGDEDPILERGKEILERWLASLGRRQRV